MHFQPGAARPSRVLSPPFAIAAALAAPPIVHGFFGRGGGVSAGIFASLNAGLGSADDPRAVSENRARAAAALGLASAALVTPYQIHGAGVFRIAAPLPPQRPPCDALVTTETRLGLAILTADCAPILLADVEARVIGAAHAGWKGLLAGVLRAVVAQMVAAGAQQSRIRAAIGPCIAQASYEVGPEFVARFQAEDPGHSQFFRSGAGDRSQFDLSACCAAQLEALGLAMVEQLRADTCALEAQYFSNRRATLRTEPDYGRNISIIALADN